MWKSIPKQDWEHCQEFGGLIGRCCWRHLPVANDRIETTRTRTIQSAMRCVRALLIALNRDYERCGKASCARARRCRGFACEPDVMDDET